MKSLLIFAFLTGLLAAGAFAEDANSLLARVDGQRSVADLDFVLSITAFDGEKATDTSTLWGWSKTTAAGNKTLLAFVEPASVQGRKMLMDGPTVYLLFPKTRNPIRLSPLQVLLGQSSNGDVARTAFSDDYEAQGVDSASLDGQDCWVFSLVAKAGRAGTAYRSVKLWVSQADLRPRVAEFSGAGDKLLKRATYGDYRTVGSRSVAFRLEVADGADPNHHTVLQYQKLGTQALPAGAFRAAYLEGWVPGAPQ